MPGRPLRSALSRFRRPRRARPEFHYVERLDAWWWHDAEFDTWHVYLPDSAAETRVFGSREAAFACLRAYGAGLRKAA